MPALHSERTSSRVLAESVLERIDREKTGLEKLKEQRDNAGKTLTQAGDDVKDAEQAQAEWRRDWHKAVSGLGLAGEVSAVEALDLLDALQACFDKLKEADDLQKRINGIDRDAAALEQEVQALLKEAAPDLAALPVEQAVLQLRTLLDQARKNRTLHDKLAEEIDQLRAEVLTAEKTLKGAREQLDELLKVAKCDKPEDLAAAISRYNDYRKLQEKISDAGATISRIGAGVPIEELARQADQVDADELPGMIASLKEEIGSRINPEIIRLSQVVGEENTRLAAMDGSAGAAEAAEKMEHELAKIRRLSERYVRVKLASKILQQKIERYREEHQDPVLKIASGYFADLTLGSFAGLRTDVNDKDEPVLVGLRPDNTRVAVEGMSRGSRDQLYLALRLATLKWRLETSEPIPFIVDDILINFDDARSRATLQALADLSEKTQVILFTHHGRIVDQAQKIKNGTVQIHEL